MQPKERAWKNREKQHEDILYDLSNATQSLIPVIERRQQEVRRQVLLRHREEEEAKYENKEYLKAYFDEMRS
eukprot:CAMPEP_0185570492 /NCGR_PEP_ID=MMETSP0434-20130131/2790_1 /TAXON_ID=626734 ORGANISM="Favella taraikaensis, Strain Fe Narragansett Bay" /NCGR_SAMPLE_ID=MMETSP0434 /ASSEMBLY_ACC=CAM_ASM_000379 /LENGTH=71 /DNA_ID=CAMNT_0028185633 /DNA_START=81 /DNA_END=296 /DNA_ORIENTATION=-